MYRLLLPLVIASILALQLCGCVAGELYVGTRRIDKVEQHQFMDNRSWYCAYVPCDERGTK